MLVSSSSASVLSRRSVSSAASTPHSPSTLAPSSRLTSSNTLAYPSIQPPTCPHSYTSVLYSTAPSTSSPRPPTLTIKSICALPLSTHPPPPPAHDQIHL